MKRKSIGKVISQKSLAPGIYDLLIETEIAKDAKAGQFVGVYTKDASALLPRPISICGVSDDKKSLRLVYRVAGKGTGEFSGFKAGDDVELLGVLGNGYDIEELRKTAEAGGKGVLLLGGGIGVPPVLELAKELKAAGVKV
ncbi:MAG: dihydroorotate dehydrogenase electron transfer subunit, partial [Clostridiales bacterium]|nr:dihydroorotate dehydrogenase electron transfer subunit [Clostridiales bacterium]